MIHEKDARGWWVIPLLILLFVVGIAIPTYNNMGPYTVYHVKIDDTVPYSYIQENFGDITHEGGDCYKIIIDEVKDE